MCVDPFKILRTISSFPVFSLWKDKTSLNTTFLPPASVLTLVLDVCLPNVNETYGSVRSTITKPASSVKSSIFTTVT